MVQLVVRKLWVERVWSSLWLESSFAEWKLVVLVGTGLDMPFYVGSRPASES